ncbi:hypothetical protein N7468_008369 [Penicillium chermesinum]|uniref:Uncharacterized protein n=1 Tax=Penicillium chermesinum TaxID=63820 RepID=A0A9W9NPM2_9EURO|nr:uncharacterized protein N7468_008369 [Penicillium chermesinum]KAJ5223827.1 hypothetical protein N7468_008369 [Penicillium chermesinum]KAJ6155346.1 hypothetical protein N7470_005912 [Penicillium chermesinum]
MSDPKLVDMEPGGENTQYESIREFTIPPAKQTGQLGGNATHTESLMNTDISPPDDSKAQNEENELAQKLGLGAKQPSEGELKFEASGDAEAAKTRKQQGYGPGSGVGA